ncbi:universal stress protein [Pedococcus bigeumensis]|uniref:universal stress protein n=1 Tax=Pedococcus bigeumensis TaxID=433644 RepID=UPI002FE90468
MITQVLVAVDDSPASLAAAKLAVYLSAGLGARLRVVHVAVDHELAEALAAATPRSHVHGRVARGREALLTRMSALATTAGVEVAALLLEGDVVPAVLHEARVCGADLVVIGRSARGARGDPYVGSQARALIELSDVPVVVVPAPGH